MSYHIILECKKDPKFRADFEAKQAAYKRALTIATRTSSLENIT